MRQHKKSRGIISSLIIIVFLGVIAYFAFQFFFLTTPSFDENNVDEVLKSDVDYCYFYEKLDAQEKIIYKNIFYGVTQYQEKVALIDTNVDQLQKILGDILYDHPELYYVNSQFQYQDMQKYIYFFPQYNYSQNEVKEMNLQIEKNTKDIIDLAKKEENKMQKAKLIYDYIIKKDEYQLNAKENQNIVSSLVYGKTVCAGYARAYQYLMNRAGEKCAYIVGTANESNQQTSSGDGHAWAMVNINDDYYYCDPTWGDCVEKGYAHTCYGYFMMSSQDMLSCYTPDTVYEETKSQNINYFQERSCYMTSYKKSVLSHAITLGLKDKTRVAEIKCANKEVFNTVKNKLDSTDLGYQILNENQCYSSQASYVCNEQLLMIEIYY